LADTLRKERGLGAVQMWALSVLAEYWADGPHSETPPGHWNTIFNAVSDSPQLQKRIGGTGPVVNDLEWDVKGYFALNGAFHNAAITAWDIKEAYNQIRPISAIRYMSSQGQSSDPNGPSYDPEGMPLEAGLVEVITSATTAPGQRHEHLAGNEGKIAILQWAGYPADVWEGQQMTALPNAGQTRVKEVKRKAILRRLK
jgi:hypothetical protein